MDESTPVLEIELQRIEMRTPKPPVAQEQEKANRPAERTMEPEELKNGLSETKLESPEVD